MAGEGQARRERGMARADAIGEREEGAATAAPNVSAFAWHESRRHQPWLCLLAALIFPPTMAPLELQRRIVDRAINRPSGRASLAKAAESIQTEECAPRHSRR